MSREYLQTPRGTRDLIGYDAELHYYLVSKFIEYARLNGFKPIITPVIEFFKLFEAKSGEEIKKSMYVFRDKKGRVLALRPEITASIIRAYLKHLQWEPKPIRLYYIGQCYRYEEPQRGRYREFWQAGLEVIGDESIEADLSIAYTASKYLEDIGVKHYYIVGNVAIYRTIMSIYGLNGDEQDHVLHLIDKKLFSEVEKYLSNRNEGLLKVINELIKTPLNKLDDLINQYKEVLKVKYEYLLREIDKLMEFIDRLKELGFEAIYEPTLVRGLAYYTSIIYEYKSRQGLDISIGGGGRYDGLTTVYGGKYEYSTGMALGLDRIHLILKEKNIGIEQIPEVLIILLGNVPLRIGYQVIDKIQDIGLGSWIIRTEKIKKALSLANKKNIDYVIIIGSREYSAGKITLRNMHKGIQYTININELEKYLIDEIFQ
jgi:histidyl-tRNA synthetase